MCVKAASRQASLLVVSKSAVVVTLSADLGPLSYQDGQLGHSLGRMRYEVMEQLIGLSRVLEARRKRQGTIFLTINFNHIVMVRTWPLLAVIALTALLLCARVSLQSVTAA